MKQNRFHRSLFQTACDCGPRTACVDGSNNPREVAARAISGSARSELRPYQARPGAGSAHGCHEMPSSSLTSAALAPECDDLLRSGVAQLIDRSGSHTIPGAGGVTPEEPAVGSGKHHALCARRTALTRMPSGRPVRVCQVLPPSGDSNNPRYLAPHSVCGASGAAESASRFLFRSCADVLPAQRQIVCLVKIQKTLRYSAPPEVARLVKRRLANPVLDSRSVSPASELHHQSTVG